MSEKKDFWVVEVIERRILDVCFGEPVTKEEAMVKVLNEDWEDVTDEESVRILEVKKVS
jgi:hypothetical protein